MAGVDGIGGATVGVGGNSGPHCRACYQMLKYMCRSGESADLCRAFGDYATTGNTRALELAHEVATPQLLERAKAHVVGLGLAFRSGG